MVWLGGGGINNIVCMKVHPLQYWKWRIRKNLLFSWGYSTSYSLITDLQTEPNRVHMCTYIPESCCCTATCCFWSVVLEKTLESPLDWKEIQPVHPEGDQSWGFIGRTDDEAETPVLWPPHVKNWLIGKDPNSGKDWRQEEKGMTEDEMVGWHHQFNGHEFE